MTVSFVAALSKDTLDCARRHSLSHDAHPNVHLTNHVSDDLMDPLNDSVSFAWLPGCLEWLRHISKGRLDY